MAFWDDWFSSSDDFGTTPIDDGGTVTQVDNPDNGLVWNPDKGWVDPSTGNVVYSGANASSTNYDTGIVNQLAMVPGIEAAQDAFGSSFNTQDWLGGLVNRLGLSGVTSLMKQAANPSTGKVDVAKLAGLAGGIMGAINPSWMQPQTQKTGYQGGIPSYDMVREQVPGTYDPNRRPGSRGQEYFTQAKFVSPSDAATAKAAAAEDAKAAEARNKERTQQSVAQYAVGGLASMASGKYLAGSTDGMEDRLDATIDGKQPAKLSHGEFVLPADIVSHLGNGNSEAGAKRLYDMMDRIRTARTGTKKQGKQINPNKFMPG